MFGAISDLSKVTNQNQEMKKNKEALHTTTQIFLDNEPPEMTSHKDFSICTQTNDRITDVFFDVNALEKKVLIYFPGNEHISVKSIGGKASNLAILGKISEINVPKWFCITANMFFSFLNTNNILKKIEELDKLCKNYKAYETEIQDEAQKIQKEILNGSFEHSHALEIAKAYELLNQQMGKQGASVAIRSSALMEDLSTASFAGLYDSFLNRKGIENIFLGIKEVFASTFNLRIIAERSRLGVSQLECLIAVIIQQMIHPQSAGVCSTLELSTSYRGIEISANFGTGESVVSGETSTDKWLVHPKKHYIIKSVICEKKFCNISLEDGLGTKQEPLYEEKKASLCNATVLKIAEQIKIIRTHYTQEIDTEFAIDKEGTLYFVQSRPLVKITAEQIYVVDPQSAKNYPVIGSGLHSVPGVTHGVLKFIEKWDDLAKKTVAIDVNDIVVTYVSTNHWSHYLTDFKGLITRYGGPSSHPILLCRERGVPALVGLDDGFEALRLYAGKEITLDGFNRVVYAGHLELKKASSSDLLKAFDPVKVKEVPSGDTGILALKQANMIFEQDGKYFRKTPTYPVKKLQQEINMARFHRVTALIDNQKECYIEGRVIDSYVCYFLKDMKDVVAFFEGMSLDKCEQFSSKQEKNINDYLKISSQFHLDRGLWDYYVDALIDLRAYILIGGIFRTYVEEKVDRLASELKVPEYYFEECSSAIQASIVEEDTLMQRDVHLLAQELKNIELPRDILELEISDTEIYQKVKKLGEHYRFDKDISLEKELDLNLVYSKVLDAVKDCKQGKGFVTMKKINDQVEFFPEHPTLTKWLTLSIKNRILQSNSHHFNVRGQWKVRSELLKLGAHLTKLSTLKCSEEIFNLSVDEIRNYIVNESV